MTGRRQLTRVTAATLATLLLSSTALNALADDLGGREGHARERSRDSRQANVQPQHIPKPTVVHRDDDDERNGSNNNNNNVADTNNNNNHRQVNNGRYNEDDDRDKDLVTPHVRVTTEARHDDDEHSEQIEMDDTHDDD